MNSKEPTFLFPAEPIRALNLIPQLCFVFLCVCVFFVSSQQIRGIAELFSLDPPPPHTKVPAPFSIIQSLTSLKWTSGRSSVISKPFSLPNNTVCPRSILFIVFLPITSILSSPYNLPYSSQTWFVIVLTSFLFTHVRQTLLLLALWSLKVGSSKKVGGGGWETLLLLQVKWKIHDGARSSFWLGSEDCSDEKQPALCVQQREEGKMCAGLAVC